MNNYLEQLQELCKGLIYMSESEYPVGVTVFFSIRDKEELMNRVEELFQKTTDPFMRIDGNAFEKKVTLIQAYFDDIQKEMAQKFSALFKYLHQHVADLTIYRRGYVQVDIIISGMTNTNEGIVVHTRSIET